jgi:hypothetical protein
MSHTTEIETILKKQRDMHRANARLLAGIAIVMTLCLIGVLLTQ